MMKRLGLFESERPMLVLAILVVLGMACAAAAFLILAGPILQSPAHMITKLFYEERWLDRAGVLDANLPVTAYEVTSADSTWKNVESTYFFKSSTSDADHLTTVFAQTDQSNAKQTLATLSFDSGNIGFFHGMRALGDGSIYVDVPQTCDPVDIHWAVVEVEKQSCTCSAQNTACLSWWTSEGVLVILSQSMDVETLTAFVNSLVPVTR